jgi:ATP-binding cassette subfamily B protein/subfamily B ATP-binding cassette protein MsbA
MRNFLRAVRNSWPFRVRLILSIACAVLAAAFWSLNFLAIHPALKILDGEKSLTEAVDSDIEKIQTKAEPARVRREAIEQQLRERNGRPADERTRELTGQMAQTEWEIQRANLSIYRLQLVKTFYTRLVPARRFQALVFLLALVVAALALKGLFEFAQESLVGGVSNLTLYALRNRLYRNSIRLDVNHFGESGSHELMARLTNDMEQMGVGLKVLYGKMVAEPLRALGCILIACLVSWQLTLLFVILVPLGVLIIARVGRMMKRASKRMLERMSDIYRISQESFGGIRVVKAFTMEPYERRRFRTAAYEYYRKAMRVVNIDALSGPVIEVLGMCGIVVVILAGAYLVLSQRTDLLGIQVISYPMDHETLLMFYALLFAVADPVRKLSSVYTKLTQSAAAADRIFAFCDRQPRVQRNSQSPRLAPHGESIELRDICFSYEPERPILTNVNLNFHFGETIALVGRNGCGKTSMVGLLPRFYDPDHGTILIDGVDIRTINLRSLRKQMAVVTQDTVLFDDTIFNNIAYGHRRASREQVEAASRRAFAHEVIEKLPRGYDTRVGEAGRSLSGGEKQRIALARAILRDPRILILDEFTSQIDAESEAKIHAALREFVKGRTTFIITHRLSALEIVDRIVVLERGRIEAVGTHAELLAHSPAYQRLHEAHAQRRAA